MDLVERIETTRFLGTEFLTWLWFESELLEGNLERPDGSALELWLDSQLLLAAPNDKTERTALVGIAPSGGREAKLALLSGKAPQRARLCITHDQKEFSLAFDAATFSMGSVNLPALLVEDQVEAFVERMHLLELLDELWSELYRRFLVLRLSKAWEAELLPALRGWAQGEEPLSARSYRALLRKLGA